MPNKSNEKERRSFDVALSLPEVPPVSFEDIKMRAFGPLCDFVSAARLGEVTFDYEDNDLVALQVTLGSDVFSIDFYKNGTVRASAPCAAKNWVEAMVFLVERIRAALALEQGKVAQLQKIEQALSILNE